MKQVRLYIDVVATEEYVYDVPDEWTDEQVEEAFLRGEYFAWNFNDCNTHSTEIAEIAFDMIRAAEQLVLV